MEENKNVFFLSEIDTTKPLFSSLIKHKISENDKKFSILYTNENGENFVNTLLSYKILISHKEILNNEVFVFEFNFMEMSKLIKIYFKWNLSKFLKKYMTIDFKNQRILIDKFYFEVFDENFLNYVYDYDERVEPEKQFIDLEIL